MVEATFHHRPTLKQQNKPFKSKHATRRALKEAAKGKIARAPPKSPSSNNTAAQLRLNRRNNAKQVQVKKRNAIVSATRIFNGVDGAPRIVAVIPLTEDVSPRNAVIALAESLEVPSEECPQDGLWKMRAERFKTSYQFRLLPYRRFYDALDACKVADYVIFVLSPSVEVDTWGDTLLRSLQSQGLPEVVSVVAPDASLDSKSRSGITKSLLSFMQYFVPSQARVYDLHVSSDRINVLRALSEGTPRDPRWRDGRTWILGETTDWESGTLKVTGVIRGAPLSANRLVHLPDYGDYQISKIFSAPLPRQHNKSSEMEVEPNLLSEPDANEADSLVSRNDPDDNANEQTWPTEDEMNAAHDEIQHTLPDAPKGTTPKVVKRIPKGMSEYQASWIIDETDDEEGEGDEREADRGAREEGEEQEEMIDLVINEDHDMDVESRRDIDFEDLDNEEEERQLEKWRNRQREEEEDLQFPDEIDTPRDVPARTRFQRYRGMRSYRTSPWDPYENLPRDYARIFQFEDFKRTERSVHRRAQEEPNTIEPGTRVTVYVSGVPQGATNKGPVTLFSLFQHEHKNSVLHFTIQRNTEYDGSVRSKDPLTLCVGPRRLVVNPVYSQHTRGGGKGTNNVHKFERYLRHGVTNVATIYGPILYGTQPCLLLRGMPDLQGQSTRHVFFIGSAKDSGSTLDWTSVTFQPTAIPVDAETFIDLVLLYHPTAPHLVAMGSFLNPDTTRVIAKRIILTGHPFKIHKKTATVRYMFFNPDDVHYFKPIQLHTKHGRTGHIRDTLGTHGYLKAHFDGPINQMDTICMSLYKRVYPKWSSLWNQQTHTGQDSSNSQQSEDGMEE